MAEWGTKAYCRAAWLVFAILATLAPLPAQAHRPNETYVYFNVTDAAMSGRFEARLSDLDNAIGLDANGDGTLDDAEYEAGAARAFAFLAERFTLLSEGDEHPPVPAEFKRLETAEGSFAQLGFSLPSLTEVPSSILLNFPPAADKIDPSHLSFALIESNTKTGARDNEAYISLIFQQGSGLQELSLTGEPWRVTAVNYARTGLRHVLEQSDHPLYLAALLLPIGLTAIALTAAASHAFALVGGVVAGHVVGFVLSAWVGLALPLLACQFAIALAIAVTAWAGTTGKSLLPFAAIAGLIQGLTFAGFLSPIGTGFASRAAATLGFNGGVLIGSIVVAVPLVFVALILRKVPLLLRAGLVGVAALGFLWVLERNTGFLRGVLGTML